MGRISLNTLPEPCARNISWHFRLFSNCFATEARVAQQKHKNTLRFPGIFLRCPCAPAVKLRTFAYGPLPVSLSPAPDNMHFLHLPCISKQTYAKLRKYKRKVLILENSCFPKFRSPYGALMRICGTGQA